MATYTLELKKVIAEIFGPANPSEYIQEYAAFTFKEVTYGKLPTVPNPSLIGLGTYPVFDEAYRPIINGKIIDEYYTREIGSETIDNWALMIRRKMDQIMPYYNKLYLSEQIPYEALDTMLIQSTRSGSLVGVDETTGNAANTTDTIGESRAVQSQTPQTMLSGNGDYATSAADTNSANKVTSSTDSENKTNSNRDTNDESLVTGYQAVASDLINKYRATLLNIDTMILLEIQDCFIALLNNGDSYTEHNSIYYGW